MFRYVLFVMACLILTSCGKKGPLDPLGKSEYPRTYPKPIEEELEVTKEKKAAIP